jgi:hypothetical protein
MLKTWSGFNQLEDDHYNGNTCLTLLRTEVLGKNSENLYFSPKNGQLEKLMVPSESAPRELSNEWSYQCPYQCGSANLNFWGNFCIPPTI